MIVAGGVLVVEPIGADLPAAGLSPTAQVETKFEAKPVDEVYQGLHAVWEPFFRRRTSQPLASRSWLLQQSNFKNARHKFISRLLTAAQP